MTDQPIPPADEQVLEALAAAYSAGATDTHNWWAAGNVEREADFGEAASDYARSIDLTALSLRPAPETTASDDVDVLDATAAVQRAWNKIPSLPPIDFAPSEGAALFHALANLPKPTEQATSPAPRPNPPVRPGARLPNGDAA